MQAMLPSTRAAAASLPPQVYDYCHNEQQILEWWDAEPRLSLVQERWQVEALMKGCAPRSRAEAVLSQVPRPW